MTLKEKLIHGTSGLILTALIMSGCAGGNDEAETSVERIFSVTGRIVASSTQELKKSFTGTLEGEQQATISAKMAEAVEKIFVQEGDFVTADQVLISLDKTGPTSSYTQAFSLYQNAEKNYNKMKYLFDQGAISEMEYDGARTEFEVSRANYDAARKLVDIRTPIAGTVTSIDVFAGDYLFPGKQVATVASIDKLRMKLGVSASDIGYFKEGNRVRVVVESASLLSASGQVVTKSSSADPVTRTFQVELEIDNRGHSLKPGMFARAEVVLEEFRDIMIVPRNTVLDRSDGNYVFLANSGLAVLREVELGVEFDGQVEVKSGLNIGDTLVTVGQDYLDDGFKVKLVRVINETGKEIEL
jgi:RND family efflux transporter MFP subunit